MEKEKSKLIKWIVSLIVNIGLIVVAALTCPDEKMHKRVVTDTVKNEIQRQYDLQKGNGSIIEDLLYSGISSLESWTVGPLVNKQLIVDNFWLFSIGSTTDSDGPHWVSLGIFNHVFVFPMYVRKFVHIVAEDQ